MDLSPRLAAMKASVEHIRAKFAFTERRACRLLLVLVSSYRYKPQYNDDSLRDRLIVLAREKRKHCVRLRSPLGIYTGANQEWALYFVHHAVASGRSIRVLNVIDAYTRESLAMEVDTSFAGLRVTRVLDQIIAWATWSATGPRCP